MPSGLAKPALAAAQPRHSAGTFLARSILQVATGGPPVEENLRRDRLTRAEILSEMRLAGIGSLREGAWAILEPQGNMSFIQRSSNSGEKKPLKPKNQESQGTV